MKKTIVAVAVAALAATSANALTLSQKDGTKVEVNGSVRVMLNKQNPGHRADLQNDGSRLEFKFTKDIAPGFAGLAYMELRPSETIDSKGEVEDKNFGDGITTKYLYAGLKGDGIGELTFGKQHTAADDFKLADPTEQGYSTVDGAELAKSKLATDGKKVVNFTSASFDGFKVRSSYDFSEDSAKKEYDSNAWQVLLSYDSAPSKDEKNDRLTIDPVGEVAQAETPVFTYAANALYSKKNVAKDVNHEVWGLAGKVGYDKFGFAVDYTHSKIKALDLKAKTWELAATYQATDAMDVYTTYTHRKNQDDVKTKAISLGSHYELTKNVETYVEYTTKKVDKADRENGYYAGLRVFF